MNDHELILKLREILDPEERLRLIDRECGDDQARKERIKSVTLALENDLSQDNLSFDFDSATIHHEQQPGSEGVAGIMLGDYRLIRRIGEGGMGEVWAAEQFAPVRRSVAIKLIKAGLHSDAVVARFEQERQALALMDHPNIAKIFDAGMAPVCGVDGKPTGPGLPYFVMELVSGVPLSRYCDEARLSVSDRLQLFIGICNAVQHAHQKGIVHRDLKPGNILVANVDGVPTPKVIDFGVAKAIAGELKDWSRQTQFGAAIGTLEYMAPEQASGVSKDIDTRADVFSLGVILYELLTGLRPHDPSRIREAAIAEAIRIIREEPATKPSARLLSAESIEQTAAARQTSSRTLIQLLQGDLDWVVLKCLENNRNRRYDSASALATDVRRFLDHEPVDARAPNSGYILRKFLYRNRGTAVAVSAIALSLLLGFAGTVWQLARARQAERLANQERDMKETALDREVLRANAEAAERVRAEKAEAEAKERLTVNQEIVEFLRIDLLQQSGAEAQIDRRFEPKRDLSVREALDRAASSAGDRWKNRPEIEAPLRETIGLTYRELSEPALALPHLQAVVALNTERFGPDHEETLTSRTNLATNLYDLGEVEEATLQTRQILERRQQLLGLEHPHTLTSLLSLANIERQSGDFLSAIQRLETIREVKQRSEEVKESDLIPVLRVLALAYQDAGRIQDALELYRKIEEISRRVYGEDHPTTISAIANVAYGLSAAGMTMELIETRLRVLEAVSKLYGRDHSKTFSALLNLGANYIECGRYAEAIALYRDLVDRLSSKLGSEHPDTLHAQNNLAGALRADGKLAEASTIYERLLQIHTRREGPSSMRVLALMNNLAATYQEFDRLDDAIALYQKAIPELENGFGVDHPLTLSTQHNLANALKMKSRSKEALELFERLVRIRTELLGADHPDTLGSVFGLAGCYRAVGRLEESLATLQTLYASQVRKLGEDHPETLSTLGGLAVMYNAVGNNEQSMEIYAKLIPLAKQKMGVEYPSTQVFIRNYAISLEEVGQWQPAADLRSELVAVARARLPAGDQRLGDLLAKCGKAQLKAQRPAEAETTLREALEILIKNEPDDWYRFLIESQVGQALWDQQKIADAEPFVQRGAQGIHQRRNDVPEGWKTEALETIDLAIRLAKQQGNDDQVAQWSLWKADFSGSQAKPEK